MGLCISPDIFHEKMNKLCNGLEYVKTCIDDLSIISNRSFEDHIDKVNKVLNKLRQKDFKVYVIICVFFS